MSHSLSTPAEQLLNPKDHGETGAFPALICVDFERTPEEVALDEYASDQRYNNAWPWNDDYLWHTLQDGALLSEDPENDWADYMCDLRHLLRLENESQL
jgi:hypothetical protein